MTDDKAGVYQRGVSEQFAYLGGGVHNPQNWGHTAPTLSLAPADAEKEHLKKEIMFLRALVEKLLM